MWGKKITNGSVNCKLPMSVLVDKVSPPLSLSRLGCEVKLIPFSTFRFSSVKLRRQPARYHLDFLRKDMLEHKNTRLLKPLCKYDGLEQPYTNLVCTTFL